MKRRTNRVLRAMSALLAAALLLLCLSACAGAPADETQTAGTPGRSTAAPHTQKPEPEAEPERSYKKVTVNGKEPETQKRLAKLIQSAAEDAEKGYLAWEIETDGVIDEALLQTLAQLGEPESGMDYDTFLCYHVPAGEQDLSVLETLYENPAVTGIRIMENSIYDVARKLHLANYDGKPAYGEIESLMQELRTKIEKESDYFIYFISINGSIDGTLIEVLNSLEEYYTRSNDDELVYHVPLDQADLSVLRTLIGHPAVEEIWITGTPYADVPTEHSETL